MSAPTSRGISRLLSANGFPRSKRVPSRIRGFRDMSEGFECQQVGEAVRVSWNLGILRRDSREPLGRILAFLTDAGYEVRDHTFYVSVISKPAQVSP